MDVARHINMNIELRKTILEQSLSIENWLSKIIVSLIHIKKDAPKTLGTKSSAFSFKNKVDLLYDLDRIDKEDYNLFILFMEIRNQLIHNIEIDTLEKALTVIQKKQPFLNLDIESRNAYELSQHEQLKERFLLTILYKLDIKLNKITTKIYEVLIDELEMEKQQLIKSSSFDKYSSIVDLLQECITEFTDKFATNFDSDTKNQKEMKDIINSLFYKIAKEKFEKQFGTLNE